MKAIKKKIIVEDRNRVKDVHFHIEEMNTPENKLKVKMLYNDWLAMKNELADLREKSAILEQTLNSKKKHLSEILTACDLKFDTYEKEVVDYEVALFLKNTGNDIIGYKDS